MSSKTIALVAGLCVLLGSSAFLLSSLFSDDDPAVIPWRPTDEIAVDDPTAPDAAANGDVGEQLVRQAVATLGGDGGDERIEATLRGRVVDKFTAPVANATVHLDFGRGGGGMRGGARGQQRRIPDPATTDADGRFAFQGQLYRNVRLSLQVTHRDFAPGIFEQNVGDVQVELDVGNLVVDGGGDVRGRVTDLTGNSVADASVRLAAENDNPLRWVRDRETLLPAVKVDNNGYYRLRHVAAGDWRVQAEAPHHQNGASPTFAVESAQLSEVEDIKLGPGFELSGTVVDVANKPVAKANVLLRQPRGGDYRTTTDPAGKFTLEHLPGAVMQFSVEAEGYLRYEQNELDPTQSRPLFVTLQDGLKITGVATDVQTGLPVSSYAVRAERLRGLPRSDNASDAVTQFETLMQQMRGGEMDEAARQQLRQSMEQLRSQLSEADMQGLRERMGGGPGMGRGRGPGGGMGMQFAMGGLADLGRLEAHPGGRFTLTGLQEGIYRVALQSPDHVRWRSAEIELRVGTAPEVAAVLDGGLSVHGAVLDQRGNPVADARVELRTVEDNQGGGRRGNGGDRMGQMMRRFGPQGSVTAEAKTDAEGRYALLHAAKGLYRVHASASGHDDAQSDPIELVANLTDLELTLGALGSIAGTVRGITKAQIGEALVVALPVGAQSFRIGQNNPMAQPNADGSYRIDNLPPGDYAVRASLGGVGEIWRTFASQLMQGSLAADVKVRGGDQVRCDPLLELPQVGSVAGRVDHNGAPAAGMQVSLRQLDESGAPQQGGPGGGPGRGRGRMGGRNLDAAIGQSGAFALTDVPAGTYELSVSRSGQRGGAPLHRQQVVVRTQEQTEVDIQVQTSSLRGRLTTDDGSDPKTLNGNILFLAGMTELPADFSPFRRDGASPVNARVQDGAFAVDALEPGQYLLVVSLRGRERTSMSVVVGAGSNADLVVPAGKPAAPGAAPQNAPGTNPRGQGGRGGI